MSFPLNLSNNMIFAQYSYLSEDFGPVFDGQLLLSKMSELLDFYQRISIPTTSASFPGLQL